MRRLHRAWPPPNGAKLGRRWRWWRRGSWSKASRHPRERKTRRAAWGLGGRHGTSTNESG
eukprot:3341474-Alexandrium_andersonii.AAC.1